MKKLIQGIVEFRKKSLPDYKETFAKLALGQFPDALFIACSDSRVVPNLFASTNPGDLFVIRNVGNMVPACGQDGLSSADESEAAAIEYAILNLKVKDIIVCGHSECGAIQALINGRDRLDFPNLKAWLRHGEDALQRNPKALHINQAIEDHNCVSQFNVLAQLEHLKTYPIVQSAIKDKKLQIHGWWFELSSASVYAYEESLHEFVLIDEKQAQHILNKLT